MRSQKRYTISAWKHLDENTPEAHTQQEGNQSTDKKLAMMKRKMFLNHSEK